MSQEAGRIGPAGETSATLSNPVHSGGPRRLGVAGVLPRRGGRKKTLSLNPEEREALENLIEEVIIDGGMGDSESASSDDEETTRDSSSKVKSDALLNTNVIGETNNDSKALGAFKISKKFYPGQLKVALKHMTDLPPRFSRKLKKAEKYLEMNAIQRNTSVSAIIKEEDEEEVLSFNMASNPSNLTQDNKASSISPKQIINDKLKTQKEKMQKDLKKTIRSLLTDLDQYVDEKDRSSISLDLPGAVSCADLERETLGYPIKPSESVVQPSPSPKVEASISKTEIVVVSSSLNTSSDSERHKNSNSTKPITQGQFNQQKSLTTTAPSSSSYSHLSDLSVSKMSGVENTKPPALTDKSAFQQYSNLTPTNFVEGGSVIVPVQPLLQQMPQIDFSVPPPSTFQFPPQYGMPPSQDAFMQNKMQFQPQFGFIELPASASNASNFVGTTPIIFQQYNTLPVVSQHQQVPTLPYAGSPGYFVGPFNGPARPMNFVPQFKSSPLPGSEPPSMLFERQSQTLVPKHRTNNLNVGNFRAPFKNKAVSNQPSLTKVDMTTTKNKYRNPPNYNKQDATKHNTPLTIPLRSSSILGNNEPASQVKPNLPCAIPQIAVDVEEETLNFPEVVFRIDRDRASLVSGSPNEPSPTRSSPADSTAAERIDAESSYCGTKTGSMTSDDSSERSLDGEPTKNPDEFLAADIDLQSIEGEIDGRKTGLKVVLGASFVRKLYEMFGDSESVKNRPGSRSASLGPRTLEDIFTTIQNSSLACDDNLEH